MPRPSRSPSSRPVDADTLALALARVMAEGPVEVFEHGQFLPQLSSFHFEVTTQAGRVLLHLWSEEGNLVRHVAGVEDDSSQRLAMQVMRFGKKEPVRLELIRKDAPRAAQRMSREKFRARFRQFLAEQFPDEKAEALTVAPDLERTLSGNFARGVMSRGGQQWAVLAAAPGELLATFDGALAFGLIWLDTVRLQASRRVVSGLRLFLPEGFTAVTAFRLQALDRAAAIELYAYDEATWRARRVSVSDSGNVSARITPLREVQRTLDAARAHVEGIVSLAPAVIDCIVPPGTREVALRFRGLEFARWKNAVVEFGLDEGREALTAANRPKLQRLVKRLETHRNPQAEDAAHPLYRAQAERWLETILLNDPARADARLNPKFLYSQVPAFSSKDRGVLDLLGVTLDGRLVVMELKAAQDLHLPLQAADYWLRVRAHQLAGDFPRFGYFGGVELRDAPPLLYLIAPGFQFHPTTDILLRYLSQEIEVARIGLNENWRRGVQVIFRM